MSAAPDISALLAARAAAAASLEALDELIAVKQGQDAVGSPGHDSGRVPDDGASTKGADMCRVTVFKDRNDWRVRITDLDTGKTTTSRYKTEAEARAAAPKLRRQYERPVGKPVRDAFADYRAKLEKKGNKARSIETTLGRLAEVFTDSGVVTGDLTVASAKAAWDRYTTTPGRKSKRLPSVATKANTLHEAQTFTRWLLGQGWVKVDVLAGLKVEGKRNRRKPQLEKKEQSRKFLARALELGAQGDAGAVAAASALLLGLRASEIANTIVDSLDEDGRVWIISEAKTEAGDRRVAVPENLRPLLLALAKGKPNTARRFGDVDRFWVRRSVRRLCRLATVPVISAHGLRGTHASLAVAAGVSGLAVAASLGHESFDGVTARHYATPESVAGARVERVLEALN